MKKLLTIGAVSVVFALAACKKEEPAAASEPAASLPEASVPAIDPAAAGAALTAAAGAVTVPTFNDTDVQTFVTNFHDIMSQIGKGDMAKQQELLAKVQQMQADQQKVAEKLKDSPEDQKKFADFMAAMGQEMMKAMQPAAK
jgi:hypothetical protein